MVDREGTSEVYSETAPTGVYFSEQSAQALGFALDVFADHAESFKSGSIRAHAEAFGPERFMAELSAEVASVMES